MSLLAVTLSVMNVCLKVWDLRKGSAIMDVKHHEDYISDITVDQARRILLTARLEPEGHRSGSVGFISRSAAPLSQWRRHHGGLQHQEAPVRASVGVSDR